MGRKRERVGNGKMDGVGRGQEGERAEVRHEREEDTLMIPLLNIQRNEEESCSDDADGEEDGEEDCEVVVVCAATPFRVE